jgi:hypothetical protein
MLHGEFAGATHALTLTGELTAVSDSVTVAYPPKFV